MEREHPRSANLGVSLTEVLIAASIISVLAALFVPVFRTVVVKERATTCISQLRQVGRALAGYLADSNGQYPPSVGGYYPEVGWAGIWYRPTTVAKPHGLGLAAYTGGEDRLLRISVCPINESKEIVAPCINPYGYPYIVNYHLLPSLPFPICRAQAIPQPSKTIVMADCVSGTEWALGTPTLLENGGGWRLSERHENKMNVLWADSHVSAVRKSELVETNFRYMLQAP